MNRFIIAGTHSGCGKTTVTCAVLQALADRGIKTVSFKCGPDYIDPMFHREVLGTPSFNLDSFFCDDDMLKFLLWKNSRNADSAVIEGVMGYYDDVGGRGSAESIAEITGTKAVIVIDCKGMSGSIGAVMKGFLEYREKSNIAGFIFNRLPKSLEGLAKKLCAELGTGYFGYMPVSSDTVGSRHLGLITASEIPDIKEKLMRLGKLAEEHILIESLLGLSKEMPSEELFPQLSRHLLKERPVIAVARDKAFCFIYPDNIAFLEEAGCRIESFSPLSDRCIPSDADGLILSGGYPEIYARDLSKNTSMLFDIREKIKGGMPVIAECGGFMYLHDEMEDENGIIYKMAGVINGRAFKTQKLCRFGYSELTSLCDNMLCRKGESVKAHEFHYWDSTSCGASFRAVKHSGKSWECVHGSKNMYAGFPHLYFYSCTEAADNFIKCCALYGGKNGTN